MAEAHPLELRKCVVRAYESGQGTYPAIAAQFSVGEASVRRWVGLHRKLGDVRPRRKGGGTPSLIALGEIEAALARVRDATAGELTAEYNRKRHWRSRIHVSSMKRALRRHGYVVKKNVDGRWRVCGPMSSPSGPPS
jgi:transposase